MSTPSKDDILKIKMGRAKRTLLEANAMIENDFKNAALNRLYYACYYAALALLFKKDIFTKTHSGVNRMLGLHYVSTEILSKEFGEFYSNLFQIRQISDYDDFAEINVDLKNYFQLANNFVQSVEKILDL